MREFFESAPRSAEFARNGSGKDLAEAAILLARAGLAPAREFFVGIDVEKLSASEACRVCWALLVLENAPLYSNDYELLRKLHARMISSGERGERGGGLVEEEDLARLYDIEIYKKVMKIELGLKENQKMDSRTRVRMISAAAARRRRDFTKAGSGIPEFPSAAAGGDTAADESSLFFPSGMLGAMGFEHDLNVAALPPEKDVAEVLRMDMASNQEFNIAFVYVREEEHLKCPEQKNNSFIMGGEVLGRIRLLEKLGWSVCTVHFFDDNNLRKRGIKTDRDEKIALDDEKARTDQWRRLRYRFLKRKLSVEGKFWMIDWAEWLKPLNE